MGMDTHGEWPESYVSLSREKTPGVLTQDQGSIFPSSDGLQSGWHDSGALQNSVTLSWNEGEGDSASKVT
eukprot:2220272-Pyramimonas_sp.AAC.1